MQEPAALILRLHPPSVRWAAAARAVRHAGRFSIRATHLLLWRLRWRIWPRTRLSRSLACTLLPPLLLHAYEWSRPIPGSLKIIHSRVYAQVRATRVQRLLADAARVQGGPCTCGRSLSPCLALPHLPLVAFSPHLSLPTLSLRSSSCPAIPPPPPHQPCPGGAYRAGHHTGGAGHGGGRGDVPGKFLHVAARAQRQLAVLCPMHGRLAWRAMAPPVPAVLGMGAGLG